MGNQTVIRNKKASFNYTWKDTLLAGIVLEGWEVKALRAKKASMEGAHILIKEGEAFLVGCTITPLVQASSHTQQDPFRFRKLLLTRKEIDSMKGHIERKGYTVIPLEIQVGRRVKVLLAIAKGKNDHDKRETLKEKAVTRDLARELKSKQQ